MRPRNSAMRGELRLLMTVAAALFLSGCGSCFEPFQKEAAAIALDTSFMVLGETSRREVHESLGQPRATSRYWGFDLFQRSQNAVSSLVMVGYDANDRVVRFESGSAYAGGEAGMCGPEENQVLQAGVAFAVIKPPFGTIDVVVSPSRRERFLAEQLDPGLCRAPVESDASEPPQLASPLLIWRDGKWKVPPEPCTD